MSMPMVPTPRALWTGELSPTSQPAPAGEGDPGDQGEGAQETADQGKDRLEDLEWLVGAWKASACCDPLIDGSKPKMAASSTDLPTW